MLKYSINRRLFPNPQIIIGGVPCQPFNVSGKQKGLNDTRDRFPIFLSAVKRYQPKLFVIENVRGLFYRNKPYLEKIITQLRQLDYLIEVDLLNSVWYNAPQNRERVFIVGHRGKFKFPQKANLKISVREALSDLAVSVPILLG